jgi:hypothetical protein
LKENANMQGFDLDIDIKKFGRYVESNLIIQTRINGDDSFNIIPMTNCKLDWYPNLKFKAEAV